MERTFQMLNFFKKKNKELDFRDTAELIPLEGCDKRGTMPFVITEGGGRAIHLRVAPSDMSLLDPSARKMVFQDYIESYNTAPERICLYVSPRSADLEQQLEYYRKIKKESENAVHRTIIDGLTAWVQNDFIAEGAAAEHDFAFILSTHPGVGENTISEFYDNVDIFRGSCEQSNIPATAYSECDRNGLLARFAMPDQLVSMPSEEMMPTFIPTSEEVE